MAHWRTMIDKDYLGSWDLVDHAGKPKDYTLTIAKVESRALKTRQAPEGKRKVTITFNGARKKMVSNSTNCETIEGMYGPDTDAWVGKRVTLYATTTSLGRKTVPCIRVRPTVPRGAAETMAEREPAAEDEAQRREQEEAADGART